MRWGKRPNAGLYICCLLCLSLWSACALNAQQANHPRLLLLSKGLINEQLEQEFLGLLKQHPSKQRVAIVVNAASTADKKVRKYQKVQAQFQKLGFDSSLVVSFDVLKHKPSQLSEYHIIYILGGNPFLLLSDFKKSGADSVIARLAHEDVLLMGYSAGALALGPDLQLLNDLDHLLGFNEMKLEELDCIGLYEFVIFPHYLEFTSEVEGLAAEIENWEKEHGQKLYRLNDNQAIVYSNGKVRLINP